MIETTTFVFDDILKISEAFARSIDIKRDFTPAEDHKVAGYIPTQPVEECLKAIADNIQPGAQDRVRLVYGPYGGGKSNFGLVVARLMASGVDYPAIGKVLERIKNGPRPFHEAKIRERWQVLTANGPAPFLPVLLSGNQGAFRQSMLVALKAALAGAALDGLVPRTAYKAALDRIAQWRADFPQAYAEFEGRLRLENETVIGLQDRLRNFQEDAYQLFCAIHPFVSNGAGFQPEDISRAHEVYRDVARKLRQRGYAGIVVVWDEFGSYFEESCRQIRQQGSSRELKEIEQFAEMCNGSRVDQLHFLALAHRSFEEYAALAKLNTTAQDEWKRISGRFAAPVSLGTTGHDRDIYDVLGGVIMHPRESRWREFLDAGAAAALRAKAVEAVRLGLFAGWTLEDVVAVTRACYPLHPATAHILPRLSNAIAQNERTLFTYTSYNDDGSMLQALAPYGPFSAPEPPTVGVDQLFTYFMPAIHAERTASWDQYTLSLYEAGGENTPAMDRRILQVMTIWSVLRERTTLLTIDMCRFALALRSEQEHADYDAAIERLKGQGVIYERQGDRLLLFAGQDRQSITKDLDAERARLAETHDPVTFLQAHGADVGTALLPLPSIEPTAYRKQYKTNRTMVARLIGARQRGIARDIQNLFNTVLDPVDGVIVYVIAQDEDELAEARELAASQLTDRRILVVVPSVPLDVREHTLQLDALMQLSKRSPYSDSTKGPAQMVQDYRVSARKRLEEQLRLLVRVGQGGRNACVYHQGAPVTTVTEAGDLEDVVGDIFSAVYRFTLPIEDENLSSPPATKQAVTTSAKYRRPVVREVLRFGTLSPDQRESLGFNKTSAEYRVVRSLLQGCGFLHRQVATWSLGQPTSDTSEAAKAVYEAVRDHVFGREGKSSVKELVCKLSHPPFGIYSLSLPIIIAVGIRDRAAQLQFSKNGTVVREKDLTLADILMDMCVDPTSYTIIYRPVSDETRAFIDLLREAIGRRAMEGASDPIAACAASLRSWVQDDVTAYGRKTSQLSPRAKALRDVALTVDDNPVKALSDDLPDKLGLAQEVARLKGDDEARAHVRGALMAAAHEVETCHNRIDQQIVEVVADVFGVPPREPRDVFTDVAVAIHDAIDAADPAAYALVEAQVWDLRTWLERDHIDIDAAFGDLAVALTKTTRSSWSDADVDKTRNRLATMRDILTTLPRKPGPLTETQRAFLSALVAALGAAVTDDGETDPLVAAADAGIGWYDGLSEYARHTLSLRRDLQDFRAVMEKLRSGSARALLLDTLPRRLGLIEEMDRLDDPATADKVRRRMQEMATRIARSAITIDIAIADLVRAAFKLAPTKQDDILRDVRVLVEERLVKAGSRPLAEETQRFVTTMRGDEPAGLIFRKIGQGLVGLKDDSGWTDRDVAHAAAAVDRIAKTIDGLKASQQRSRIALSVNGNQIAVDLTTHAGVEAAAKEIEGRLQRMLDGVKIHDAAKVLGVTLALQRLISRQRKG